MDLTLANEDLHAQLCHNRELYQHTGDKYREAMWDKLHEDQKQYRKNLRPWVRFIESGEERRSEAKKLESAWFAQFGNPDDPEIAASIERTVAFLNRKGP